MFSTEADPEGAPSEHKELVGNPAPHSLTIERKIVRS